MHALLGVCIPSASKEVSVFKEAQDEGWVTSTGVGKRKRALGRSPATINWWLDPARAEAFNFFSLDALYSAPYFKWSDNFLRKDTNRIVRVQQAAFALLMDRPLRSVGEFGGAAGHFTRAYAEAGLDYQTVEGTKAGVARIQQQPGVSAARVQRVDLRLPFRMNSPAASAKFDLAVNTEVAEHIEIPFHSQLVQTLTQASDLIWFSYAAPPYEGGREAHIHHSSTLPMRYWLNLFDFFDYRTLKISEADQNKVLGRGRLIFYRRGSLDAKIQSLGWPSVQVNHTVCRAS